jgi:hypothetical protein
MLAVELVGIYGVLSATQTPLSLLIFSKFLYSYSAVS